MKLYHGTCGSWAEEALENGFRFGKEFAGSGVRLYLTDDLETAEYFAKLQAWVEEEKSCVVLEVEVPKEALRADRYAYGAPLSIWLKEHNLTREEWCEEVKPPKKSDWKTSLREVHAVWARKDVLPPRIKPIKKFSLRRGWSPKNTGECPDILFDNPGVRKMRDNGGKRRARPVQREEERVVSRAEIDDFIRRIGREVLLASWKGGPAIVDKYNWAVAEMDVNTEGMTPRERAYGRDFIKKAFTEEADTSRSARAPKAAEVYVPGGVDPDPEVFEAFHAPAFRRHGGPGQSGVENPYRENRGGSLESAYARARALYRKFYKLEPRGERLANLTIPEEVFHVGSAKQVLYRSDKLNPTTLEDEGIIDYFHDHNAGVKAFLAKSDAGRLVRVPTRVIHTPVLVVLGKCLGFTFETEEGELEGKGKKPLPELCALPPNGSVLLVVQNRRTVLAMMWGGRLTVKPEGITG